MSGANSTAFRSHLTLAPMFNNTQSMHVSILGAGAWGTALAIALSGRHDVVLWGRNETAMREVAAKRENRAYLPGFPLSKQVTVTADFAAAVAHVGPETAADRGLLIVASALAGLRPLLQKLHPYAIPNIVWLCKGFEEKTQLLPHQIVREELGREIAAGALSGPSFAQEVARGLP